MSLHNIPSILFHFSFYPTIQQEHDCKLTKDIVDLIDREADLLMRGTKDSNLTGLRNRISTLFLQYLKTPSFNPQIAKLLKVISCFNVLIQLARANYIKQQCNISLK